MSEQNAAIDPIEECKKAIREVKTVLKNQFAITTLTAGETPLTDFHSMVMFNSPNDVSAVLPDPSSVSSSEFRKDYYFSNLNHGRATIKGEVVINGAIKDNPALSHSDTLHVWADGAKWYGIQC